ncbi:MAG: tyrosine-type recombinase/integrase [Aestuariivirga sp.]
MAEKPKLTWNAKGLESVKVSKRIDFTDAKTEGLSLRVTPSGNKSWSFLYVRKSDGKKRRVTIGDFGADHDGMIGLAEARQRAVELRAAVNRGLDPAEAKAAEKRAETVSELLDLFIQHHPRPDASWTKECKRIFDRNVKPLIGTIKLPALTRQHIRLVIKGMKDRGVTTAVNRTLAALRRALSWAVSEDMLVSNPAQNLVTEVEESPKDRALSVAEVRAFWAGIDNRDTYMSQKSRLALKLILATGQRPGEVCGAARSELNLEDRIWTIPSRRAKNKRLHAVPLSDLAVELFEKALKLSADDGSDFVFTSRARQGVGVGRTRSMQSHALSHAMRGSLDTLGLKDASASPHDLRRTCASHMARLGFTDSIVSKVLNHSLEQKRSVTARVYIQHDFLAEKRIALEAWAAELQRIIAGQPMMSNVIELKGVGNAS